MKQYQYTDNLNDNELETLQSLLIYDILYYGPITPLLLFHKGIYEDLHDENSFYLQLREKFALQRIIEIQINQAFEIFIETNEQKICFDYSYISENHLRSCIQNLINESNQVNDQSYVLNESNPLLDFELAFPKTRGSAISPPVSKNHCLTIRFHPESSYNLATLEGYGMFNARMHQFLKAIQKVGSTVVIAGTMGTGKTTLLNSLINEWDKKARKAVIEDTPEIDSHTANLIKLQISETKETEETRKFPIKKIIKACKRHSFKYIALSEARDGDAWEILQLSQNILGSLITYHYTVKEGDREANKALNILAYLCSLNSESPSLNEIKSRLASIVEFLVLLKQDTATNKRFIDSIHLVESFDNESLAEFKTVEIFKYSQEEQTFKLSNKSKILEDLFDAKGVEFKF